ncbi:hypothetical protein [Streptomyces sp. NPDC048636]|uniref:hypothetical protein n=1 Tax=Streptomyces sp. NPDC048636 TaxID=3155762 RepID=UPI00343E90DC
MVNTASASFVMVLFVDLQDADDTPAPVVARMLGHHDETITRLATEAGGTWRRWALIGQLVTVGATKRGRTRRS